MPIDRDGRHLCWICKKPMQEGRTVVFTRIGFVEFVCRMCYEKPNIRDIITGKTDTGLSESEVSELIKFEPVDLTKKEKKRPEEFERY